MSWSRFLIAGPLTAALVGCGGGGGDDDGSGPYRTYPAHVAPLTPPPFSCGAVGVSTTSVMDDLNYFWQSSAVACSCEFDAMASGCQGNAVVYGGQGYGYIFFDASLLDSIDASTGSSLPADMIMAHEFGHNIQLALSLPSSGGKFKELQADCLAGFYVGSRIGRGLATENSVIQTFNTACGTGDPFESPWWVPGAHGTCAERVTALRAGIDGYLSGLIPGQACPSA